METKEKTKEINWEALEDTWAAQYDETFEQFFLKSAYFGQ